MRGVFGYRIVESKYWPRVPCGTEEVRYPAHPIVAWLFRQINRALGTSLDSDIIVTRTKVRDANILIDERMGIIYCSPAQAHRLRLEASRSNTMHRAIGTLNPLFG